MLQKPLLIYLADDDNEDRMLFKEALDELNMNVAVEDFDNGVTLMEHLLMAGKPLPDAIYLDLNMPLMNGEECLNDIRNEPQLSKIPIIIYSTYIDEAMADTLQNKGANWYLMKPSTFGNLKNLLRKSLNYVYKDSNKDHSSSEFIITVS
ncbi:CheY-like chemotaxis protein [Mariniflexile fucanivorans]|uniref:CheY-like chemotaxis protein n=1 Tax=Mariniflexile fucanivorans TaxID=264023 RepID=A0A4R1RC56_9FLAO|nr:response regulator [Mariniflexile fucanivorans]TCL63150.1 CheY-like chemotaxis protein [Mariniflexile fucanivorans]